VIFHSTKLSLAWQAALEFTNRIMPLPGLTHASSTPEYAASRATGLINTTASTATKARQAIPARRMKVLFMRISLS
jgi:hypothetical protein